MPPVKPFRSPLSRTSPSSTAKPAPESSSSSSSSSPSKNGGKASSVAQLKLENLKRECRELEEALGGEDAEQIIKRHEDLLHLYNERKNATLVLINRLAVVEQVSPVELCARLGIEAED
ncbi:hypothetical protein JCM8547_008561 [Rhodosporidiobolus lusitaniae]